MNSALTIPFAASVLFAGVAFLGAREIVSRTRAPRLPRPQVFRAWAARGRRKQAVKSLSYILELLRLQVGGGENIERAIGNIAKNADGVWGEELSRVWFSLERGVPFEEALSALARRMDLEDLDRLVRALRQARELGASLSDTLAIQSEALRARRRQRAEERARVAAVKISIPLVFCIFPALLIIYLAPAVLRVMQAF